MVIINMGSMRVAVGGLISFLFFFLFLELSPFIYRKRFPLYFSVLKRKQDPFTPFSPTAAPCLTVSP